MRTVVAPRSLPAGRAKYFAPPRSAHLGVHALQHNGLARRMPPRLRGIDNMPCAKNPCVRHQASEFRCLIPESAAKSVNTRPSSFCPASATGFVCGSGCGFCFGPGFLAALASRRLRPRRIRAVVISPPAQTAGTDSCACHRRRPRSRRIIRRRPSLLRRRRRRQSRTSALHHRPRRWAVRVSAAANRHARVGLIFSAPEPLVVRRAHLVHRHDDRVRRRSNRRAVVAGIALLLPNLHPAQAALPARIRRRHHAVTGQRVHPRVWIVLVLLLAAL